MNDKIKEILWKHIGTVNSFIDDNGHNRFDDCVKELSNCIEEHYNRLEEWAKERKKHIEDDIIPEDITSIDPEAIYGYNKALDDLLSFIAKNK